MFKSLEPLVASCNWIHWDQVTTVFSLRIPEYNSARGTPSSGIVWNVVLLQWKTHMFFMLGISRPKIDRRVCPRTKIGKKYLGII